MSADQNEHVRTDGADHPEKRAVDLSPPVVNGPGRVLRFFSLIGKIILPLVVVAAAVGAFLHLKSTKPEVKQRAQQEKIWPVKSMAAEFADHQPILTLFGQTVSGRRVEMRALVQGEIVEVGPQLREGGIIKQGELLVKIDPFQYEGALIEAKARFAEAKAKLSEIKAAIRLEEDALEFDKEQLEIALRDLERAVPLAEKGTVSKKLADDRRVVVSQRRQSVQNRQNNLLVQVAKSRQQRAAIDRLNWKVDQAKRNLRDTVLKAPFDSYVTNVNAEVGRMVSINDRAATLLDKSWIDVSFTLSDRQYGRILSSEETLDGRDVEVRWYVGDNPLTYKAKIERVSAEISSKEGGVLVYARLTDPDKRVPIRSGAFVEVLVPDRVYKNVVRIPQTALYDGDKIYIIDDERLNERKVQIVGGSGADLLIRGAIKKGDLILVTRLSGVGQGVKVRDVTSDEGDASKTSLSDKVPSLQRTAKSRSKGTRGTAGNKGLPTNPSVRR